MDQTPLWPLAIAAALGTVAWLYEKAWQRHEKRIERYELILGALSAFTIEGSDPDKIEEILVEQRKLWLSSSVAVAEAFQAFLETMEGARKTGGEKQKAMSALVQAMRKDASLWTILFRPFGMKQIPERLLRLKAANRRKANR